MNTPRLALALAALGLTSALAFTDPKTGFTSTAPSGWKQSTYPGAAVVYLAPRPVKAFNPNINVVVQTVPAGLTLKQYTDVSLPQLKQALPGSQVISLRPSTLGGLSAVQLNYTATQSGLKLYFTQTYTVLGQRAYLLTGTTIQGQEAALAPVMAAFVKSFKIKR